MKNYKIKIEDVFAHTNGGLDIIRHYLPHIDEYVGKNKHFALRDEKTPSCTIRRMSDGNYVITDFGTGQRMNGIMFIQHMENVDFGEAVRIAASRHGVPNAEHVSELFDVSFSQTDAGPNQPDGQREFIPMEETPKEWLEILFSRAVWSDVEYRHRHIAEAERPEAVLSALRKTLTEQHWHPLEYYTTVKNRKLNKISASTYYPIFMIEEKGKDGQTFKKIYQPKAKQKKHRFFYHGKFDKNFLHGLMQVGKAYEKGLKKHLDDNVIEDDPSAKAEAIEKYKLDQVIYCTGGSDAINLYALGYDVVYPSSEHFKLTLEPLKDLFKKAHNVMTCPDLDTTGQRANFDLCMNPVSELYLNISTIELPTALQKQKDQYGRPCKDLRDFLNHYTARDLRGHIRTAKKFKFWDYHLATDRQGNPKIKFDKPVFEYRLSSERVLYFLEKNGFYRHEISDEEMEYVYIKDNVVQRVRPEDIKGFVIHFLRQRFQPEELINIVHRSPVINDSLYATLPVRELDFRDHDRDTQYMFFENATWEISDQEIKQLKPAQSPRLVWSTKILPHRVSKLDDMFTVTKPSEEKFKLEIHNPDSIFFRFLIQTSRVHWRKELEDNLAGLPLAEQEQYRKENQFNIAGPNLTEQEQYDQIQHLLNKMYAFGYLMHRYKSPSRAWIVLLMDDTPNRDDASHGGTGKSIFFNALGRIKDRLELDGKNKKLFDDNHVFEQVDKSTDIIYYDDCDKYFPFERIFSMTTGSLTKNPKGTTRTTLAYKDSPKMGATTNYSPDDLSDSTMRRILFGGMSNYYHDNTNGNFNETRQPIDDFGKNLFDDYTPEEWNLDLNFMAQCCRFYMSQPRMIKAPMANIMERSLTNEIGLNFLTWAEVFFTESRLDSIVFTSIAIDDYLRVSGIKMITPQGFNSKMRSYARLKGFNLNPKELCQKDGRAIKNYDVIEYDRRNHTYIKTGERKTQAFIYLQTIKDEISNKIYDPVIEIAIQRDIDQGMPAPVPGSEKPQF